MLLFLCFKIEWIRRFGSYSSKLSSQGCCHVQGCVQYRFACESKVDMQTVDDGKIEVVREYSYLEALVDQNGFKGRFFAMVRLFFGYSCRHFSLNCRNFSVHYTKVERAWGDRSHGLQFKEKEGKEKGLPGIGYYSTVTVLAKPNLCSTTET